MREQHLLLRVKAKQTENVERITLSLEHQVNLYVKDGLPEILVAHLRQEIATLRKMTESMKRELPRIMKKTPLGEWAKETKGLSYSLFLLLGLMPPLCDFKGPASVWKYVGLHVVDGCAPKRRRGYCTGFNVRLRSYAIARVADGMMKCRGAYRYLYDERKEATRISHPEWTDGHRHADAMRIMAKAILRDAWCVANDKTPKLESHQVSDIHNGNALPFGTSEPAAVGQVELDTQRTHVDSSNLCAV